MRALVCVFLFLVVAFLDAERSFLFFVAPAFSPPPARPRFQEIHEQETNSLPLRFGGECTVVAHAFRRQGGDAPITPVRTVEAGVV